MRHSFVILPLISALFLTFASCAEHFSTDNGEIWATTYHIVYSGNKNLHDSIRAQLEIIDNELSMFNPKSKLAEINRGCDTTDSHFQTVFDCATAVSRISDGRYDPTVAPLVDVWGFGRTEAGAHPSDSVIASCLTSVGIAECRIDNDILTRKSHDTEFDFSSLAKGYGVDCVADMFDRNNVKNYMIEVGGEIRVRGTNPRGKKWRIQIDEPTPGAMHSRYTVLELGPDPTGVATSGNYRNYRPDENGGFFGHTISPLDGRPIVTEVLSATIVAPTCMFADALATACMTGTYAQAEDIINKSQTAALIIVGGHDSMTAKKIGCLPTTENP